MSNILVVTGSARPNSVNKAMVDAVKADLEARGGLSVTVADVAALNLPFFDAPLPPSAEGYEIPHDSVKAWSDQVLAADGIVFVVPEYNHSMSAVQKNAIDWLYKEWAGKPAAFVGYGWYAAANSHATFLAINNNIKLDLGDTFTGLQFMKDINPDGSFADEVDAKAQLTRTLDELVAKVK